MRAISAFLVVFSLTLLVTVADSARADEVDNLIQQLQDPAPDARIRAAGMLANTADKSNEAAIEALGKAVVDQDPRVQRAAIAALKKIQPDRKVSIPLLTEILTKAQPSVAIGAVHIMAEYGEEAVPFAVEALKDEDACYWACLLLQEIGPKAKDAVPALIEVIDSEEPEVRREVLMAIASIGPDAKDAVPALTKILEEDKDPAILITATFALGNIGEAAKSESRRVAQGVKSDNAFLVTVSAWAVAKMNPDNETVLKRVVPILIDNLQNRKQRDVRVAAARALIDLQVDHKILLPQISKFMDEAPPEVITEALEAVAAVGAKAVPGLIRMLKYPEMRPAVAQVIGGIGPDAAPAVDALVKALADSEPRTQAEILIAIGAIGPGAKDAIPAAVKAMAGDDDPVRFAAVYALGKIGPEAKAAMPELLKNLESDDKFYRVVSAIAAADIDPAGEGVAEAVQSHLIEGLSHARPFVRIEAARALGNLGPKAASAKDALEQLSAKDEDPDVRATAADSLKKIGS